MITLGQIKIGHKNKITFGSALDQDQAQEDVELDLASNCLTLW